MKKVNLITLAVAACGMSFGATAATVSGQSQPFNQNSQNVQIKVGELPADSGGFHGGKKGDPAIGVSSVSNAKLIGLKGLTGMAAADSHGVHVINTPGAPGSHTGMGVFNFAKVANAEVYFGEWSHTGGASDNTHTAWFSGKDATTAVPTGGKATYQVAGINQYSGSNKLNGTLDADFGAKTLKGSIANASLTVGIDAKINNNASFAGSATANGVSGKSQGQFYGQNAESLAGIATFSDHSKDTAFGGSKK